MRIGKYRVTRRGYLVFGIVGIILIVCLGMAIKNIWIEQPKANLPLVSSESNSSKEESATNMSAEETNSTGLSLEETNKVLSETLLIIYFKPDDHNLDADYYENLDEIVNTAIRFKEAHIVVEGHYNGVPHLKPSDFRMELAANRAEVVEAYLVSQGIDPSRIETLNMGATKPVNKDESWQEIQKNRRVVIYFKKME